MGILSTVGKIFVKLDEQNEKPSAPAPAPVPDSTKDEKELAKIRAQIEEHEAVIRSIHDKLSDMISKISERETRMRKLLSLYDKASKASKDIYKVQILDLQNEIAGFKDERDLHARNLEKEQEIIKKLKFMESAKKTKTNTDDIIDLNDDFNDIKEDLEDEDDWVDELKNNSYKKKEPRKRRTARDSRVQPQNNRMADLSGADVPDEDEDTLNRLRAELKQEEASKPETETEANEAETDAEIEAIRNNL